MIGGTGGVSTPCGDGVRHDVTELDSGAGTAYHSWPLQTRLPLAALSTAPACAVVMSAWSRTSGDYSTFRTQRNY